jgi:hypothetical protein
MHYIFLVHGTWGSSSDAWYQSKNKGQGFQEELILAIASHGVDVAAIELVPFEWSGKNTHAARTDGAMRLAETLLEYSERDARSIFHFVAHSHGGNVVLKALEIYINRRPSDLSASIFDSRDIPSIAQAILDDYSNGLYPFPTEEKEIKVLLSELQAQLDLLKNRQQVKFRLRATDDSVWDSTRSTINCLLSKIYRHIFTLPQHHQIGSVVTLGTPFYEKTWVSNSFRDALHYALHLLSKLHPFVITGYFYTVVAAWALSLTPWIIWIGFNPLEWQSHFLILLSLLVCFFLAVFTKADRIELPVDTNVYFDESSIPYYIRILGSNKLFSMLCIHSSYLDEAYCLLATYPTASRLAQRKHFNATRPKLWNYVQPTKDVGLWYETPFAKTQKILRLISRFIGGLVYMSAFPARLLAHNILNKYIDDFLQTRVRAMIYGLPVEELQKNSDISVRPVFEKQYINTEGLDAARFLLSQAPVDDASKRYQFLWDEEELMARFANSNAIDLLSEADRGQKMQLLALEERIQEYFGTIGVRHSMYTSNSKIIGRIAKFITGEISNSGESNMKLGRLPEKRPSKAAALARTTHASSSTYMG